MSTVSAYAMEFHVSANHDSSSLVVQENIPIGPRVSERPVAVKAHSFDDVQGHD